MQQGFIKLLIIFIFLIVLISILEVNLKELFQNRTLGENFAFVFGGMRSLWENYLLRPLKIFWDTFQNLLWEPAMRFFERLQTRFHLRKG